MPWMATSRRSVSRRALLAGLGGIAALCAANPAALADGAGLLNESALGYPLFAAARREADGRFAIALFDDAGLELARVPLPDRGHGVAVSPDRRRLMAFARRPGTFALLIDPFDRAEPRVLSAIDSRHFYGHGCFSPDGRLVYAVENDYANARGVVGVYDVSGRDIDRLGEFDTGGIGPHDILIAEAGKTLVIANGGIETHPARPREKLNLQTMRPSVVFLDRQSGDLLARHQLADHLHQLSLRHMALDGQGQVWVGGQFEGDGWLTPPLIAKLARDADPKLLETPRALAGGLKNYIGSVVSNRAGDVIATSAPRGGQVLFWDAGTGRFLGADRVVDGCGLAPLDGAGFLISDGTGGLRFIEDPASSSDVLARPPGVSWDNHMSAI
jgi:hypothetical protein